MQFLAFSWLHMSDWEFWECANHKKHEDEDEGKQNEEEEDQQRKNKRDPLSYDEETQSRQRK